MRERKKNANPIPLSPSLHSDAVISPSPPSSPSVPLAETVEPIATSYTSIAYLLWLFGGMFGAHHIYLGRISQAFLWSASLGGLGFGWFRDAWRMSDYVAFANGDPLYMKELESVVREPNVRKSFHAPSLSWYNNIPRLVAQLVFASWFSTLAIGPLGFIEPQEAIDQKLDLLPVWWTAASTLMHSFGAAAGISIVGQASGLVEGPSIWSLSLVGAFGSFISLFLGGSPVSSLFQLIFWQSRCSWNSSCIQLSQKRRKCVCLNNMFKYYLMLAIFLFFALSTFYNFATFSVETDEVDISNWHDRTQPAPKIMKNLRVRESIANIRKSQAYKEFWATLYQAYEKAHENGWRKTYEEIVKKMDVDGVDNAYKVLGLDANDKTLTFKQVKKARNALAMKYHPDKYTGDKSEAEQKFREIEEAFAALQKKYGKNKPTQFTQGSPSE